MAEDEVDGVAEDLASAALQPHPARAGHDDDLGVAADRLVDDRAADVPGARDAADHGDAVRVPDCPRLVELLVRLANVVRQLRVEGQIERHLDRRERDDRRAPLRREPAGEVHRLVGCVAGRDRDEDAAELESGGEPVLDRCAHRLAQGHVQDPPPVDDVDDEAEGEPAEPCVARARVLDHDIDPRQSRADAADHREQRPVDAAPADVRARAPRDLFTGLARSRRS